MNLLLTKKPDQANVNGFTLLELLVSLSIAAILLTIAIPAWHSWVQSSRIQSYSHTLFAQMQMARAAALSGHQDVVFCPSADQQTCKDTAAWQEGWILFRDEDGDANFGGQDVLLRVQAGQTQIAISSAASRTRIRFQPSGTTGGSNGTYLFCDTSTQVLPVAIILSRTGRARISTTAADGSALVCSNS